MDRAAISGRPSSWAPVLACLVLSGCTVVPVEADRAAKALQTGTFDAEDYAQANWETLALPSWADRKRPLAELIQAADADLDVAGLAHGRRAGEGSLWTFVGSVEGRVVAVDREKRAGRIVIEAAGVARPVEVQAGPVVSGFALRDSLPFIDFDDFPNQIAYADAGRAMTDKALSDLRTPLAAVKVGDRIAVTGVFAYGGPDAAIILTPVSIDILSAQDAASR